MNCIVCMASVPDTASVIKVGGDGTGIDESGIKWIVSPYDEFAIEEALKIKEAQGGEVVIFDRSWYNRAGVERVMGFATGVEVQYFLDLTPFVERHIQLYGIVLLKYWLEVSDEEQEKRFRSRIEDAHKQWKLSPMDLEARRQWFAYSRARDAMLDATDTPESPWHIVDNNDKYRGRLNCIRHLLDQLPYETFERPSVELPGRDESDAYDDVASMSGRRYVPEHY